MVVMREGERTPRSLRIDAEVANTEASAHPFDLGVESVPYGSGVALVVTVPDVYDNLGELFARALTRARAPSLVGVVLDLRGNGGGSTEGAIDTLGAFLPGARLFPMRSKSGAIDTESGAVTGGGRAVDGPGGDPRGLRHGERGRDARRGPLRVSPGAERRNAHVRKGMRPGVPR